MKPPEFLGPYRVGESLGKGGMGTVFKAVHERSGDEVAVKLIATQLSDEMRFRRRFDAEVKTLQRLKHPNIVRLIGFGEEHGMLFYSMEYVAGETLQVAIRREKRIPWAKALDVAIQVCSALKHAHDIGVIHRDLKPANLILREDGQVKLVDFGISKIFGYDQTAAGSVMGTADYMAPEQASDRGVTARTDLYSLGCVMYAMLCGKPPFRGKNITEVIDKLKHQDPVSLDLIDPDLPEDIVHLVDQLLSKTPEDRPPTALAVMNRLKAMKAGLERMQTISGDPRSPGRTDSAERQSLKENGDTSVRDRAGTRYGDAPVPPGDTHRGTGEHISRTEISQADPKAGTIHGLGRGGRQHTEVATGITERRENVVPNASTGETSGDAGGQTHFQTVSEGEVRGGFFVTEESSPENGMGRTVSIAAMSLALITGVIALVVSLQTPSPDVLLSEIETYYEQGETFQAQKETTRFIKLFPDHPQVEMLQDRLMVQRVENAVKRLRLKAKLRTSEGPLYESAFLEAMDLRATDPKQAAKKLRQWREVFSDSKMDPEDEKVDLARLATFEAERLSGVSLSSESKTDPRLDDLMRRIDQACVLEEPERTRKLEGIVTFSEDLPWAEPAMHRAETLLEGE